MNFAFRPILPRGWVAEWDNNYREWYYVNLSTGRSQWEKPVSGAELTSANAYPSTRASVPRNVPEGWKAVWDPNYEEWFYANIHTAETQWEMPLQPVFAPQNKLGSRPKTTKVSLQHAVFKSPLRSSYKETTPNATSRLDAIPVQKHENDIEEAVASQIRVEKGKGCRTRPDKLVDGSQEPHKVKGLDKSAGMESVSEESSPHSLVGVMEKRSMRLNKLSRLLDGQTSVRRHPYQDLDDYDGFRILELHPGSRHEPLTGTLLQPQRLSATIAYDALSYRWSDIDGDDPALIQIGDTPFPIGPNLHAALVQFRYEYVPRWIWVDQICIDQSHEAEKIQQLKIMANIYSQSQRVLIWLGEASNQSDIAMEFFPIFVEQIRRNDQMATLENSARTLSDIIKRGGTLATALNHLFERPWFGRVWTLQEVALATRSEVWCGPKSFDFQVMETFAQGCYNDKHGHWLNALELIRPALKSYDPENPPRPHDAHVHIINNLKAGTIGSARILNLLRHLDCSRDEDRIYSVLRFFDAGFVNKIHPDHKLSVTTLYHHAAIYGIQRGELDYLGAAGLSQHCVSYPERQRSTNEPFLSLPSWVPDWTYRVRTHSYWVLDRDHEARNGTPLFFAGGAAGPSHEWHFSEDKSVLSATGIVIDDVKDCALPFHVPRNPDGVDEAPPEEQMRIVRKAQTEYQSYTGSCMNLAMRCTPKHGSSNVQRACRQSLVGGMMPEGSTTTKGAVKRATDEATNALFEDFELGVWILNESNSLPVPSKASLNARTFRLTDEEKARYARLADARERLGDFSKASNLPLAMADACKGRRFFITSRHHLMGMAPDLTKPGDKVCVLNGCCAPFIIRPKGTAYQLIGECFVAGVMDGEIMESKGHLSETISLV